MIDANGVRNVLPEFSPDLLIQVAGARRHCRRCKRLWPRMLRECSRVWILLTTVPLGARSEPWRSPTANENPLFLSWHCVS
jgi:hypothetical protein